MANTDPKNDLKNKTKTLPIKRTANLCPAFVMIGAGIGAIIGGAASHRYTMLTQVRPLQETVKLQNDNITRLTQAQTQQQVRLFKVAEQNGMSGEFALDLRFQEFLKNSFFRYSNDPALYGVLTTPDFKLMILNNGIKPASILDPEHNKTDKFPHFYKSIRNAVENGSFHNEFPRPAPKSAQKSTLTIVPAL